MSFNPLDSLFDDLQDIINDCQTDVSKFIDGNNSVNPLIFKIRAADLNNLQILPHILKGAKVADIMAILGSIDVIMGSVDR